MTDPTGDAIRANTELAVVPIEPTEAMIDVAQEAAYHYLDRQNVRTIWKAMLAAAPKH